jgi:hypothetical protein
MGPLGFEPRTKGFAVPRDFPRERTISSPSRVPNERSVRAVGCGTLLPVIKGTRTGRSRDAVQPPGSLCTFRRCTAGSAQDRHRAVRCGSLARAVADPEGFPEFVPSTARVTPRRHRPGRRAMRDGADDESPALTVELQARSPV